MEFVSQGVVTNCSAYMVVKVHTRVTEILLGVIREANKNVSTNTPTVNCWQKCKYYTYTDLQAFIGKAEKQVSARYLLRIKFYQLSISRFWEQTKIPSTQDLINYLKAVINLRST